MRCKISCKTTEWVSIRRTGTEHRVPAQGGGWWAVGRSCGSISRNQALDWACQTSLPELRLCSGNDQSRCQLGVKQISFTEAPPLPSNRFRQFKMLEASRYLLSGDAIEVIRIPTQLSSTQGYRGGHPCLRLCLWIRAKTNYWVERG